MNLQSCLTTEVAAADLQSWDSFVEQTPYSDVAQLSSWADVRRSAGFSPAYLFVKEDCRIVGGALLLRRRIPLVGWVYYVSGGPVICPDLANAVRTQVVREITTALRRLMRTDARMLFLQPPLDAPDVSDALIDAGFRPSQMRIAPTASLRIDLDRDVEEIRAGLKRRLRNWTRRWPTTGVTVRAGGEEDIALFAGLIESSAGFQDYTPLSQDYIKQLYDALRPRGNAALFIGEAHGVPVAATLYTNCGGVVRARLTGLDRTSDALRLNVPAAIAWHTMLWARAQGLKWYDFGGISGSTAEALLNGETLDQKAAGGCDFFKLAFRGEPIVMPAAVEVSTPQVLLSTLNAVQNSDLGRRVVADILRRMRGGTVTTA